MSVKGGGGPPKSVTFFLEKILSVKGGGTPLTEKIRKVVFLVFPYLLGTLELRMRDPDRDRDQIGTLTKHNMDKLV